MTHQTDRTGRRKGVMHVKTRLQNRLIWVIFVSIVVPTVIFGGAFYLLVVQLIQHQDAATPQELVTRLLSYISLVFPLGLIGLLYWAFYVTEKVVGPVERITRELDERIQGTKTGPIQLRPKDSLIPMVDKVNEILAEWEKLRNEKSAQEFAEHRQRATQLSL